ncbi:MAG: hypothetical protein GY822_29765, partial [Deltaproteobacteria bacterium]|nr:hypothetical protein [Deltaproteobacteria bacterium]
MSTTITPLALSTVHNVSRSNDTSGAADYEIEEVMTTPPQTLPAGDISLQQENFPPGTSPLESFHSAMNDTIIADAAEHGEGAAMSAFHELPSVINKEFTTRVGSSIQGAIPKTRLASLPADLEAEDRDQLAPLTPLIATDAKVCKARRKDRQTEHGFVSPASRRSLSPAFELKGHSPTTERLVKSQQVIKKKSKEITTLRQERDDLKLREEQDLRLAQDQAAEISRLHDQLIARKKAEAVKDDELATVRAQLHDLAEERATLTEEKRSLDCERELLNDEKDDVRKEQERLIVKNNELDDTREKISELRDNLATERKGLQTRETTLQKRLASAHR